MAKENVVGWFEIPVINMDRAIVFYEEVFGFKLERNKLENIDMAWFPWVDNGTGSGGSLVHNLEWYKPSSDGVLVYFTAPSGNLETELSRVEKAGGKILMQKKLISESHGYMAVIVDTEGNRIALHARK